MPSLTPATESRHRAAPHIAATVDGSPSRASTFRVMTYNIELGMQWEAVRDVIRANDADIICLQEVPDRDATDLEGVQLSHMLAALDRSYDFQVLSRNKPLRVGNLTLVKGTIRHEAVLERSPSRAYGFISRVHLAHTEIVVANLHLAPIFGPPPIAFWHSEVSRTRQLFELQRRLYDRTGPIIALGDFNTFWPMPACAFMRHHWNDARKSQKRRQPATRPTYGFPMVIDHIFTRGPLQIRGYEVIESEASDHRPVIATVELIETVSE